MTLQLQFPVPIRLFPFDGEDEDNSILVPEDALLLVLDVLNTELASTMTGLYNLERYTLDMTRLSLTAEVACIVRTDGRNNPVVRSKPE